MLRCRGLDGQRLGFSIHDDAVRCQHLLPFLVSEIHIAGDDLLIGIGGFLRTWTKAEGIRKLYFENKNKKI